MAALVFPLPGPVLPMISPRRTSAIGSDRLYLVDSLGEQADVLAGQISLQPGCSYLNLGTRVFGGKVRQCFRW